MKNVTSAEFQRNFGLWKRKALIEPIAILVHGRPSVVLLSTASYNTLLKRASASETPSAEDDVDMGVDIMEIDDAPSEADIEELQRLLSGESGDVDPAPEEIEATDVEALKRLMMDD